MSAIDHNHAAPANELERLRTRVAELEAAQQAGRHNTLHDDGYLLRALLRVMPDFVFFKDTEARFVRLTDSHARMMGYDTPQDVLGKNDYDLFPYADAKVYAEEEQRVLAGEPLIDRETAVTRADGSIMRVIENKIALRDEQDAVIGLVGISRDISKRVAAEEALKRSQDELRQVVEQQQQLIETIRELSTPIIPIHDHVIVLPLIGAISSGRAQQITERLLIGIHDYQADVVIIDITGVPVVDTAIANHLLTAARAVALLGAQCVLVGVSPEIAQTVVQLGVSFEAIITRRNLQQGIAYALARQGQRIVGAQD